MCAASESERTGKACEGSALVATKSLKSARPDQHFCPSRSQIPQHRGLDINSLGLQPQELGPEQTPGEQFTRQQIANPAPTKEEIDPASEEPE